MALTAPSHGPTGTVTPPLTTTDLSTYLNTPVVTAMQQPLTAAIRFVERRCGPVAGGQYNYLASQSSGSNRVFSPGWNARQLDLPLQGVSLTSVDALVDPYGYDVVDSLTTADVDWEGAIIVCPYQRRGSWQVKATSARDSGDAETLKEAVLVIAKQLWEARRGMSARPAAYGGSDAAVPVGFAVPARAAELMNDLLLVSAG